MTNSKIEINDPRLTAYALGELSESEAQEVKEAIGSDPELLAFVEETKEAANFLSHGLAQEAQPRLSLEDRAKIEGKATAKIGWLKFSGWTYTSLGLAAAGLVAILLTPRVLEQSRMEANKALDQGVIEEKREAEKQAPAFAPAPARRKAVPSAGILAEDDRVALRDEESAAPDQQVTNNFAADRIAPPASAPVYGSQGGAAGAAAMSSVVGNRPAGGIRQAPNMMAKERAQLIAPMPCGPGTGAAGCRPPMPEPYLPPVEGSSGESYPQFQENPWIKPAVEPLSTFSIDVDTASYTNVRRMVNSGQIPPKDAVRIEEMVNYFPYAYAPPTDGKPFAVHVEMAETPWTEGNQLVRIALRGKDIPQKERPNLNLCFLIDVSGSMNEPNKLPLVQESLKLLVDQMQDQDRISLVVYAGASGLVLPPTSGDSKRKIKEAIDNLRAGGSTNGGAGLQLAYSTLQSSFVKGGVNRVVLASDGDFNVGITNESELEKLIVDKAKTGAFLSVLGFGMGNYKDSNMMKLSDKGNGNYAYIDTLAEAKKALVEQMAGTLITIAKDVKIQVEFNPAYVGAYRLVGYEKRLLAKEDFNDDKKDAGEIGAGHTVTAIYEIVPAGKNAPGSVDPLKYQANPKKEEPKELGVKNGEALTVKLRYKDPDGSVSKLIEKPVKYEAKAFAKASGDFQFAAAVAGFGMLLKDSDHKGVAAFEPIAATAAKHTAVNGKENDYRKEFVELVRKTSRLKQPWKSAE